MGSISLPRIWENLITERTTVAAVLSCHLHADNTEHTLNECLPLAAVLLLRLSGNSLLVKEYEHSGHSWEGGNLASSSNSAPHCAVYPSARLFPLHFNFFIHEIRWTQGDTLNYREAENLTQWQGADDHQLGSICPG